MHIPPPPHLFYERIVLDEYCSSRLLLSEANTMQNEPMCAAQHSPYISATAAESDFLYSPVCSSTHEHIKELQCTPHCLHKSIITATFYLFYYGSNVSSAPHSAWIHDGWMTGIKNYRRCLYVIL